MNDAFFSMSSAFADLVESAAALAVLAVVATVVRRHRPDAYRTLLAWAVGAAVTTIGVAAAYRYVVPLASADSAVLPMLHVVAIVTLVRGVANGVLALVLVRGLVVIAQPPKPLRMESDAPYR